jgi:hypothetical protein
MVSSLLAGAYLAFFAPTGEELMGMGADGDLYRIDPSTGVASFASDGVPCQALARDSMDQLFQCFGLGSLTFVYRVDPRTGVATRMARLGTRFDVRAISFDAQNRLYAVVNPSFDNVDHLYRFDLLTETSELVGSTGMASLQSLAFSNGLLYTYNIGPVPFGGLVGLDPLTASVVSPSGGPHSLQIQGLGFTSTGRLFGGRVQLYELDLTSGAVLSSVTISNASEISGVDYRGFEFISSTLIQLDFETEDDSVTPLVNGQRVSSPEEFGEWVRLSGGGPNLGPTIFDSTPGGPNDPSQDRDLLVGLGNVLILQSAASAAQSQPGFFQRPNDSADGGFLVFDFVRPSEPVSLDLIDLDRDGPGDTLVKLVDVRGLERDILVPAGWTTDHLDDRPPGFWTLDLRSSGNQPGFEAITSTLVEPGFDPRNVRRMEIYLGGSGAVDNLRFEPTTAPRIRR